MSRALIIELERCGLGRDEGPPPSIRCGLFRVFFFPKSMAGVLRDYEFAMAASRQALEGLVRRARPEESPAPTPGVFQLDALEAELLDFVRTVMSPGRARQRTQGEPSDAAADDSIPVSTESDVAADGDKIDAGTPLRADPAASVTITVRTPPRSRGVP
jgi:hypothetical protein